MEVIGGEYINQDCNTFLYGNPPNNAQFKVQPITDTIITDPPTVIIKCERLGANTAKTVKTGKRGQLRSRHNQSGEQVEKTFGRKFATKMFSESLFKEVTKNLSLF